MRALDELRVLPDGRASSTPVGLARAGVGAAAMVEGFEIFASLRRFHDAGLLSMPRLEGFPAIPATAIGLFLGIWLLAAAAFCAGWHTRSAGAILVALMGYILLLDHQLYSNHLYLMLLLTLLLTLADGGAAFSIDARRAGRRETIPAWPVILIRLQVTIVYAFAAAAKLNLIYLSGIVLRVNLQLPGLASVPPPLFSLAAIASVATETFLAVALWSRRLRPVAFVVGVGFHLTILATMRILPDLLAFALLMAAAYLTFFASISMPAAAPAGGGQRPGNPALSGAGG